MTNTSISEFHKRIDWIDMAKGYGMILVILGHVGCGPLEKWIYSFHLPLFFFLSGLVFHTNISFNDFFRKRVKGILIPYFCLGSVVVVFEVIFGYLTAAQPIAEAIYNKLEDLIIQIRCWDLWYLATLFCAEIIFYFIVKAGKSTTRIGMITCTLTAVGFVYYRCGGQGLIWNLDVVFFALFFLYAGLVCQRTFGNRVLDYIDAHRTAEVIIFFASWAVNIILMLISYKLTGQQFEMYMGTYGIPLLSFPASIAGIFGVIILAKWTDFSFVRYIGTHTLIYFAWHQTIIMPLVEEFLKCFGITPDEATGLFTSPGPWLFQFAMILLILTGVNQLISVTPLRFMIGK